MTFLEQLKYNLLLIAWVYGWAVTLSIPIVLFEIGGVENARTTGFFVGLAALVLGFASLIRQLGWKKFVEKYWSHQ